MASRTGTSGHTMHVIVQAAGPIRRTEDLRGRLAAFATQTSNSGFNAPSALPERQPGLIADRDYDAAADRAVGLSARHRLPRGDGPGLVGAGGIGMHLRAAINTPASPQATMILIPKGAKPAQVTATGVQAKIRTGGLTCWRGWAGGSARRGRGGARRACRAGSPAPAGPSPRRARRTAPVVSDPTRRRIISGILPVPRSGTRLRRGQARCRCLQQPSETCAARTPWPSGVVRAYLPRPGDPVFGSTTKRT